MSALLEIDGVSKRLADEPVVDRISFEVRPGEVFGLIGPDGAGKTTTMRMAAGLISPTSGNITVLGRELSRDIRSIRVQMGYMPQHFSLYGDLSVQENLRFFAGMYGVSQTDIRRREQRLLGMAQLGSFRDRAAGALSGGMYKKLALSCALIHSPRLLLLDEPTNGVDPISRRELWAFLEDLLGEGVGALLSTPYMDEAERCHRVGLLVDGRLVAVDSPARLKQRFSATVFEVLSDVAFGAMDALTDAPGVEEAYNVGRKLHVVTSLGPEFAPQLEKLLAAAGHSAAQWTVVSPSFEDIFMSLSSQSSQKPEAVR